jgi:hypothetical protein
MSSIWGQEQMSVTVALQLLRAEGKTCVANLAAVETAISALSVLRGGGEYGE